MQWWRVAGRIGGRLGSSAARDLGTGFRDIPEGAAPLMRGMIGGLALSNGTDSDHDIDIAVGAARDSTNVNTMSLSSTLTKQIDANWAEGDAAGGFPSALTLSNDTTYHVFLIGQTDGTTDAGFDTSTSATNLLSDASSYSFYRRIGSVVTDGSSNILGFSQFGETFLWSDPPMDLDVTNVGATSAQTQTLTLPTGIQVEALLRGFNPTNDGATYFSSPDVDDEAASESAGPLIQLSADSHAVEFTVRTNTSAQIRSRSTGASADFRIVTVGWIDHRERWS